MPQATRRPTLLEELVRTQTTHTMTESVRIAIEQIGAEMAKEALADEEFRRTLRALVRTASQRIMADLLRENGGTDA